MEGARKLYKEFEDTKAALYYIGVLDQHRVSYIGVLDHHRLSPIGVLAAKT